MDFRVKSPFKMRIVLKPEKVRRLVERAPEAEVWVDGLIERLRPTFTILYQVRRHLATGAVALVTIWFFVHVMFGANGMVAYRQKKAEFQKLEKQIRDLKQENVHYANQIQSLENDPKAIEKEAREQLHYARPGEVIYVPPPEPPAVPARRTAKK